MTICHTSWMILGSALAAGFIACSGGGEEARPRSTDGGAADSGPTGTLTLGERTFTFQVSQCDLGEVQTASSTLRGTGRTGDGTRMNVSVDRSGDQTAFHSVSLNYGRRMDGTGFSAQAIRTRMQGIGWSPDPSGTIPSGPLILIEGRTVRAEGTFDVDDAGTESRVLGQFEATCPP